MRTSGLLIIFLSVCWSIAHPKSRLPSHKKLSQQYETQLPWWQPRLPLLIELWAGENKWCCQSCKPSGSPVCPEADWPQATDYLLLCLTHIWCCAPWNQLVCHHILTSFPLFAGPGKTVLHYNLHPLPHDLSTGIYFLVHCSPHCQPSQWVPLKTSATVNAGHQQEFEGTLVVLFCWHYCNCFDRDPRKLAWCEWTHTIEQLDN